MKSLLQTLSESQSSHFIRGTGGDKIAKLVGEGVIGERNHGYTTDVVLDQDSEKTRRWKRTK